MEQSNKGDDNNENVLATTRERKPEQVNCPKGIM